MSRSSPVVAVAAASAMMPSKMPSSSCSNSALQQHVNIPTTHRYVEEVKDWLESENVAYTQLSHRLETTTPLSTHMQQHTLHFLQLETKQKNKNSSMLLHLLPSPMSLEECLPAGLTRTMTDKGISFLGTSSDDANTTATAKSSGSSPPPSPLPIIHLHQDVWSHARAGPIVRARLLFRLCGAAAAAGNIAAGGTVGRRADTATRIFARQTVARRIDGPTATAFLHQHHLWGATKTKYSFGLYYRYATTTKPTQQQHHGAAATTSSSTKRGNQVGSIHDDDDVLVAVATFSSRRHVQRGGGTTKKVHRSHELIRYCARRDGTVVGGITKLLAAFLKSTAAAVAPVDDIVTVIDRDWGAGGTGWHPLGFATVAVMPPVTMAICAKDGTRRHLVGAGIISMEPEEGEFCKSNATTSSLLSSRPDRMGLPKAVLEELASIDNYEGAMKCLDRHGFYPVHDAGVERLFMVLPSIKKEVDKGAMLLQQQQRIESLWKSSIPTYATSYYSNNSGINALLRNAEET